MGGVALRGGGTAVAVPEENLIKLDGVTDAYGPGYSVAMHECAHILRSTGLSASERRSVNELYASRKKAGGPWTDDYASKNPDEYFAQTTLAFFGRNARVGANASEWIRKNDPEMFRFLQQLYARRKQ